MFSIFSIFSMFFQLTQCRLVDPWLKLTNTIDIIFASWYLKCDICSGHVISYSVFGILVQHMHQPVVWYLVFFVRYMQWAWYLVQCIVNQSLLGRRQQSHYERMSRCPRNISPLPFFGGTFRKYAPEMQLMVQKMFQGWTFF